MKDTKYRFEAARKQEQKLKGYIKSEIEDLSALLEEDRPMDWLMNVTSRIQQNIAELHRVRSEQKVASIAIDEAIALISIDEAGDAKRTPRVYADKHSLLKMLNNVEQDYRKGAI